MSAKPSPLSIEPMNRYAMRKPSLKAKLLMSYPFCFLCVLIVGKIWEEIWNVCRRKPIVNAHRKPSLERMEAPIRAPII